jgi:type I restriction enzyme M protein
MIASLNDHGRMAVVLPNGALFRTRTEQAVRRDLIEADIVEAVIQLPKDMFYGAGIPACYLVVNKDKPAARRGRVLFIDASDCYERQDTKNVLRDEDIERIVAAFRDDNEQPEFSAWVPHDEVRRRRYNLTVRRYIRGANGDDDAITLAEATAELRAAREAGRAADAALDELLAGLDEGNGS